MGAAGKRRLVPYRAVRGRLSPSARIAAATQQSDATSTRAKPTPMLAPAIPERLTVSTTPMAVPASPASRAQIAAHLWENRKANAATTRPQIRVMAPSPEVALTEIPNGPLAHGSSEPNTTRAAAAHANHWLRPTARRDAVTAGAGATAARGAGRGCASRGSLAQPRGLCGFPCRGSRRRRRLRAINRRRHHGVTIPTKGQVCAGCGTGWHLFRGLTEAKALLYQGVIVLITDKHDQNGNLVRVRLVDRCWLGS